MPPEWPSNGQSDDSPRACAEDSPLVADATVAFVDRAAIDWPSLLSRARASSASNTLESLHSPELIRRGFLAAPAEERHDPRSHFLVRLVAIGAGLQTAGCLAVVALAFSGGATIAHRTPQIVLALALTTGSVLLALTT